MMISGMIDETSYYLDVLVETLREKTDAGKLDWRPTASEDTYVAAVKGLKTYTLRIEGAGDSNKMLTIVVKDTWGNVELEFTRPIVEGTPPAALIDAAAHIASRLDDRINRSLELLNSL